MTNLFALDDWFLAGAGFEIAAGYLLAKGLLLTPEKIRGISGSFFSFNPIAIVERVHDREVTKVALAALLIGFALQGVGYFIDLSLPATVASTNSSVPHASIGFGFAALGTGIVLVVAHLLVPPLERRTLIEIAHYDERNRRMAWPSGDELVAFGRHRWPPTPGESLLNYCNRVWKVSDISEGPELREAKLQ